MEQKSKVTKAQLERRVKNALVFIPKDKEYQGIYFTDKGLRLEATNDYVVVSTNFHRHVFDAITTSGMSRPYIYVKQFIEIALAHDCKYKDERGEMFYSYRKLLNDLRDSKEEKDRRDYLIAFYVDMWLQNIFNPLYMIDETEAASFMTYLDYCCGLARNVLLLGEHSEDITNKRFIRDFVDKILELTQDNEERVIFHKLTDKERMEQEVSALAEIDNDETLKKAIVENGNQNKKAAR